MIQVTSYLSNPAGYESRIQRLGHFECIVCQLQFVQNILLLLLLSMIPTEEKIKLSKM